MREPPWFITLEGGEGAGKSTQIVRLRDRFERQGVRCIATREPGGSPGAEQIRQLLVTGAVGRWSAETEALLNYAARDDHLRTVIRPALSTGVSILCDRFMDSTAVYQGHAGGVAASFIKTLEHEIVADTRPDLTLILDLDVETGLNRAHERGDNAEDRYERKGPAFHARLRDGFLAIAAAEPGRCVVIDAGRQAEEVAGAIWQAVTERLTG